MKPERIRSGYEGLPSGVKVASIYSNDRADLLQQIGPRFGVQVTVIARANEPYTHRSIDLESSRQVQTHAIVPEGTSYVGITSPKVDIADFWQAVKQAAAQRALPQ